MPIKLKASDLVRNLTSKYRFVPLLEKSIAQHDYEWEFKYEQKGFDDAWHPSGDCTPDLQTLYHIASERIEGAAPKSISLSLRKTFMIGHFWHQWLQFHAIKASIVEDESSVEVIGVRRWDEPNEPKSFHWSRGAADLAPALYKDEEWVIDFKTMNPDDFKKESAPERWRDKWECQMNIYMDFFGIDRTCIIGVNKLDGSMKEFVYYRNDDLIKAIYKKWEIVSKCLDEGIEPPKDEIIELPLKGVSE